jgi:hypothetical protein
VQWGAGVLGIHVAFLIIPYCHAPAGGTLLWLHMSSCCVISSDYRTVVRSPGCIRRGECWEGAGHPQAQWRNWQIQKQWWYWLGPVSSGVCNLNTRSGPAVGGRVEGGGGPGVLSPDLCTGEGTSSQSTPLVGNSICKFLSCRLSWLGSLLSTYGVCARTGRFCAVQP